MPLASADQNKEIYRHLHDQIGVKRFAAESPIRRHTHRLQYQLFVDEIPAGSTVLDAGCGEGMLSILLAKKGCIVTGTDISEPNVEACKKYAAEDGVTDKTTFMTADIENLPFPDKSFDYVVSSHVLEHVPDFQKGAHELGRIARKKVIAAIPTCLNPCAWVLLGGDKYWTFSRKTPYAIIWGKAQVLWALITNQEGVNEGYAGRKDLIHIWRFPWKGKKALEAGGLKVERYCGSSYIFPYFPFLIPLSKFLERFAWVRFIRNFGYGTTYVCDPLPEN